MISISFCVQACDGETYMFDELQTDVIPRVGERINYYYMELSTIVFEVTEVIYTYAKNRRTGIKVNGEEVELRYRLRIECNKSPIPEEYKLKRIETCR